MQPHLYCFGRAKAPATQEDYPTRAGRVWHSFEQAAAQHWPQTELDLDIVKSILAEYRIHNADVTLRYDANADDLIDVIEGNRAYIPCIYLLNKIGNFMPFYCIVVSFFVLKS